VWDSAAFSSIFLASGFSCSQTESTPAHTQVTQTVGWLSCTTKSVKKKMIARSKMKKSRVFYFILILTIILSACGPSQEELSAQTAIANTSIAKSWTSTPTLTPTLTPTPTKTPLPTTTPIGGGQGQILFLNGDIDADKWEIYSSSINGTGRKQLTRLNGTIADPAWSPNGDKVVFSFKKNKEDLFQLYTMNFDGSDIKKISTNNQRNYNSPDWSPDGTKIVFHSERDEDDVKNQYPHYDIYIMNFDGTNEIRITNDPTTPVDDHINDYSPDWSPDGKKIVFISYHTSYPDIFTINPDGTDQLALTKLYSGVFSPKWTPDGKQIMFISLRGTETDVNLMNFDGSDLVQIKYDKQALDQDFNFSPDGTKISFTSCCFNLSTMNLDGSNLAILNSQFGLKFDWKP